MKLIFLHPIKNIALDTLREYIKNFLRECKTNGPGLTIISIALDYSPCALEQNQLQQLVLTENVKGLIQTANQPGRCHLQPRVMLIIALDSLTKY